MPGTMIVVTVKSAIAALVLGTLTDCATVALRLTGVLILIGCPSDTCEVTLSPLGLVALVILRVVLSIVGHYSHASRQSTFKLAPEEKVKNSRRRSFTPGTRPHHCEFTKFNAP